MTNKHDPLLCTYNKCKELQTEDGEFCAKHYPSRISLENRIDELEGILDTSMEVHPIPSDVYSEEFLLLFHDVLNKFVDEYDDMAQMNVLQKARDLLQAINEQ